MRTGRRWRQDTASRFPPLSTRCVLRLRVPGARKARTPPPALQAPARGLRRWGRSLKGEGASGGAWSMELKQRPSLNLSTMGAGGTHHSLGVEAGTMARGRGRSWNLANRQQLPPLSTVSSH